ncbi:MAG TPA: response regulator [Candidatus Limnocylindrales bacterium]|nr:response regulator [Candidatus Limnocylindrales bacterium]
MTEQIKVVIVDDIAETRDHLAKLLGFESDIEVVGSLGSGEEVLRLANEKQLDVVLLDINMPGMDGIATAEQLALRAPSASIIMMSVQGEPDYLRRAMLAGAREFLVKPFSSDELAASIRQVHQRERLKLDRFAGSLPAPVEGTTNVPATSRGPGRVVTFFAPKGGVGRTTLAVNFAVAAAAELGQRVALIDGGLQFGDVGVLLNLNPKNQSIADVVREMNGGDLETLDSTLVDHSSGIRVLMAPPSPEQAELVTADHLGRIVGALRQTHDLVVIDSTAALLDATLAFLDQSDIVLTVLTLEITNIKNIRQFLALVEQLGFSESKVQLVLNRADSAYGIRFQDVESSIGRKISHTVVSDGRTVVFALNRGVPFVVASRQSKVAEDVVRMAKQVLGTELAEAPEAPPMRPPAKKGIFQWRAH